MISDEALNSIGTSTVMKVCYFRHHQHEEIPTTIVLVPRRCDILCGTGRSVVNHPGNMYFRGMMERSAEAYANAPTRVIKSRVVKDIVSEVLAAGARILKQHPVYLWWNVVQDRDRKVLRDKTTRYLRAFLAKRSAVGAPAQVHEKPVVSNNRRGYQGEKEKDKMSGISPSKPQPGNPSVMDGSVADYTITSVRTIQEMQSAPLRLPECHQPPYVWIRTLFSTIAGASLRKDCAGQVLVAP